MNGLNGSTDTKYKRKAVILMKKVRWFFEYGIRISVKLVTSYLILIIIPLIILGVVLYSFYLDAFIVQASKYSNQLMNQINKNIESYFLTIDQLSMNIAYDDTINNIIDNLYYTEKFESPEDEQYLNDMLSHYLLSNDGVDSIHIYCREDSFHAYKKGTINKYYRPTSQDYLTRAKTTYGESFIISRFDKQFNEKFFSISIIRPIISMFSFTTVGTVVINVNHRILRDLIDEIGLDSQNKILILNEKDEVLYSEDETTIGKRVTDDLYINKEYNNGLINVYDQQGEKYLFVSERSSFTYHKAVVLTPYYYLTKSVNESSVFIMYLGLVLFAIAFFLSILITGTITRPINELKDTFSLVGQQNRHIEKKIDGRNEIGELWLGFNKMVKRIDGLIEEIIDKEDEKRRAEIKALQMQINPHFLYNALSSIKYLAIIQNANNINRITDLLISLLKEIANNQTDYTTIRDEIDMIKKYIEIQKVIYLDKFKISIVCPKALYEKKIIKFILQPIVENSIFHGILPNNKKGFIRIKIYENEQLVIKVIDNGIGLAESKDWQHKSNNEDRNNHIGLKNIDSRIKLFYGPEYGINLRSKKGVGTIVTIVLPREINEREREND